MRKQNAQSAEKQAYVRSLLLADPRPTTAEIMERVKTKFPGDSVGAGTIWKVRRELKINGHKKKPGPKPGGKRKRRATRELVDLLRAGQEPDSIKAALDVLQLLLPLPVETQRRVIMGVQVLLGQV